MSIRPEGLVQKTTEQVNQQIRFIFIIVTNRWFVVETMTLKVKGQSHKCNKMIYSVVGFIFQLWNMLALVLTCVHA